MILGGIKRKNIVKRTEAELKKANGQIGKSADKVQSVLLLIDESINKNIRERLSVYLEIEKSKIELITFVQKLDDHTDTTNNVSSKDFGFFGKFHNDDVKQVLYSNVDLLINYVDDNLYLNNLAVQSSAKFKIGLSVCNQAIYDLTIAVENCDEKGFNGELKKYLKILNKL